MSAVVQRGVTRLFDIVVAAAGLVCLSPILVVVAVAVRATSRGPILHRATRAGRHGHPFTLHKFRTMRPSAGGPRITSADDDRVVPGGRLLRRTRVDELPQLWDVLRGEMSIVGPRPEDLSIVREHYTPAMWSTLDVRPGLTSPGALYGATEGATLPAQGTERAYLDEVLPLKLALERVYVSRKRFGYDLRLVGRTLRTVWCLARRSASFPDLPELGAARELLAAEPGQ